MFRAVIHWILSSIALMMVANYVPGFYVNDVHTALIGAAVIGLLNATIGFALKVITFPFAVLTAGLFLLVVNAAMIMLAANFVTGFVVYGWTPALIGAAALAVLGMVIRMIMKDE